MRKELRADKKKAFELGRNATIYGRAFNYGSKKVIKTERKLEKAYSKDPSGEKKSTQRLNNKWQNQSKALLKVTSNYSDAHNKAKNHVSELTMKYGKDYIKGIKYKEFSNERLGKTKIMNERVTSGKEWLASALITAGSIISPSPVKVLVSPASSDTRGMSVYRNAVKREKKE